MGQIHHNEPLPLQQTNTRHKRAKTFSGINRVMYYPGYGQNYLYIQQLSNPIQNTNTTKRQSQIQKEKITIDSIHSHINTNTIINSQSQYPNKNISTLIEQTPQIEHTLNFNNKILQSEFHNNDHEKQTHNTSSIHTKPNSIIINNNTKEQKIETEIERNYFIIQKYKNKQQTSVHNKWSVSYIKSFQNWIISTQTDLLNQQTFTHLNEMKIHFDEYSSNNNNTNINKNNFKRKYSHSNRNVLSKQEIRFNHKQRNSFSRKELDSVPLGLNKWSRKNYLKEIEQADLFKQKLNEIKEQDPIKFDLTEYLNMLTIDNYDETKQLIFNTIKEDIENQKKFLEVLFQKAIHEKSFVSIYAKLCKDLDKELPQKLKGNKMNSSAMRGKLIDKCKEIFKIDKNEQMETYIKAEDSDERKHKIKTFILGNVNFIGELISIKLLSKKIVFQCIDLLFKRYDRKEDESGFKLISLEGIVILVDKFGTLIHKQKDGINEQNYKEFIKNINEIIIKLDNIQKNDDIPGYVKYKIINLIEKKNGGWEESQFEKNITAKSKEEVRKAFEESQHIGNNNKDVNNKLNQEQIDDYIRKDLIEFKDFIENGNDVSKYEWEIVSEIYNERQNTIAEILGSFTQNCIDFIQNDKTLKYAIVYLEEFIQYYGPKLSKYEKKEIINESLILLSTVNSISLDNPKLLDVWAYVLYLANQYNIMSYSELDAINELGEDDLKNIFDIMKKIGDIDRSSFYEFEKMNIVIMNKKKYDEIVGK